MNKKLIYTALWLIGIMGALSIWVVSAAETRVIPGEHENITYILNGDEEHSFNAWTLTVTDCEDVDNPTDDCTIITILDRNLWATVAWTGCDYTTNWWYCPYDNTYWYHFQWWNNYWFKPWCDLSWSTYYCSDTITSNAVNWQVDATTISYNPNNQEYYYSWVFHYGNPNWLNDNSKIDLWWWSTDDTTTFVALTTGQAELRRWPCPEWFHVPSIWELTKLSSMFTGGLDMHNQLKIPFAG